MFQQTLWGVDSGSGPYLRPPWVWITRRAAFVFGLVSLAACLAQPTLRSACFTVEGKISYEAFAAGGPHPKLEAKYSATVCSGWWLITTESDAQPRLVVEWRYDGSNLFMKQRFVALNDARAADGQHPQTGDPGPTQVINELITAFTNDVPPYDVGLCFPIWLAFASGAHFDS